MAPAHLSSGPTKLPKVVLTHLFCCNRQEQDTLDKAQALLAKLGYTGKLRELNSDPSPDQ